MSERYLPKKRTNPVKAIREACIECMGGHPYMVKDCTVAVCALHDFRMGKNPFRKVADSQREAARRLNAGKRGEGDDLAPKTDDHEPAYTKGRVEGK